MKVAADAVLLTAVAVLLSLALVFMLVRTEIVSPQLWSFYPVILAVCLAVVFAFTMLRVFRRKNES
jgi:hypothetical protein